jgi:hypothetical protein
VLRSQAARWLYNDTCYENGTDYHGWDIRTVPRTADPAQCQVRQSLYSAATRRTRFAVCLDRRVSENPRPPRYK